MRIGWVSEDYVTNGQHLVPGGCTFYRCMLPSNAFPGSKVGKLAFTAQGGFGVRLNAQQAQFGFDVIVFKQIMQKWIPGQMEIAKGLGQTIVVDVDDHFDGLHDANQAKALTDPELNRVANRDHLRRVIELSDMVIASTPFLYEYYSELHPNVCLVPNSISPHMFTPRKVKAKKPVIGWVGAMGWRSNDVETLRPWLGDWLAQHDLLFHHAGHMDDAPSFADAAGVDPNRMILSPMRPLPQYPEMMDMDIGIVPLSFIPFNEAKSYLKGLEYAASGIPFVASATDEYRYLESRGLGRTAVTPEDWVTYLTPLLDYALRKREAHQNLRLVEKHFTIHSQAQTWIDTLSVYRDRRIPVQSTVIRYESVQS